MESQYSQWYEKQSSCRNESSLSNGLIHFVNKIHCLPTVCIFFTNIYIYILLLRESILIIKNKYSLKLLQILTKFSLWFKKIVIHKNFERMLIDIIYDIRYWETQIWNRDFTRMEYRMIFEQTKSRANKRWYLFN